VLKRLVELKHIILFCSAAKKKQKCESSHNTSAELETAPRLWLSTNNQSYQTEEQTYHSATQIKENFRELT
jgi:hypothetical protein